jgi:hypothetical protein
MNQVYMSYWQMVQRLGLETREPLLVKMDIEGWEVRALDSFPFDANYNICLLVDLL